MLFNSDSGNATDLNYIQAKKDERLSPVLDFKEFFDMNSLKKQFNSSGVDNIQQVCALEHDTAMLSTYFGAMTKRAMDEFIVQRKDLLSNESIAIIPVSGTSIAALRGTYSDDDTDIIVMYRNLSANTDPKLVFNI